MNKYISIFPFIKVEQTINMLGSTIHPGEQNHLIDLGGDTHKIIKDIQSKLFLANGTMDNFSIVLSPYEIFSDLLWNLNRIADFLRFKLSYTDENFDYDQGLFIALLSNSDGSIKLSINGNPPTILGPETFTNKFNATDSKKISVSPEEVPNTIHKGLSRFWQRGFGYQNLDRFWRALDWYSKSFIKDNGLDKRHEICCLAIAFESLLNLPEDKITSTFKSFVSNFFGESENLVEWAEDFYNLRSKIVHGDEIVLEKLKEKKSKKKPSL